MIKMSKINNMKSSQMNKNKFKVNLKQFWFAISTILIKKFMTNTDITQITYKIRILQKNLIHLLYNIKTI